MLIEDAVTSSGWALRTLHSVFKAPSDTHIDKLFDPSSPALKLLFCEHAPDNALGLREAKVAEVQSVNPRCLSVFIVERISVHDPEHGGVKQREQDEQNDQENEQLVVSGDARTELAEGLIRRRMDLLYDLLELPVELLQVLLSPGNATLLGRKARLPLSWLLLLLFFRARVFIQ